MDESNDSGRVEEQVPADETLEEPSTEKEPGDEPKKTTPTEPEPSHEAVGIGVIGGELVDPDPAPRQD